MMGGKFFGVGAVSGVKIGVDEGGSEVEGFVGGGLRIVIVRHG